MTVEEIFKELAEHMLQGVMFHSEMITYYNFLSLCGDKRCHEYHMIEESKAYRKLQNFYICRYDKLLPESEKDLSVKVIPDNWYNYTRNDVSSNTIKNSVKTGLEKWVEWETETKKLYEAHYKNLMDLGEVKSAMFVGCLICDVDKELKHAKKYHTYKRYLDYNVSDIVHEQKKKHKKYKCKMRKKDYEHAGD